jgi:phosphotriesterase-related protein
MSGLIRTVTGDIDPPGGTVLVHEHLQIDLSHNKGPQTVLGPNDQDDVIADLSDARHKYGLALVADLSVPGSGRDPGGLRRISQNSRVSVVAATGYYWDPIHRDVLTGTVESLCASMAGEIENGIGDTGVRCGVIKVGTDVGAPPAAAERLFVATAKASRDTGAAVVCHTSTPDQAQWQIDVLEGAGANLSRVLISHLHTLPSFDDLCAFAARGIRFGFDQIGFASGPTYAHYADLIVKTIEAGLLEQLMISTDVARRVRLQRYGGTSYGTLFSELLPLLRERGVTAAQIETLVNRNPCGFLARA